MNLVRSWPLMLVFGVLASCSTGRQWRASVQDPGGQKQAERVTPPAAAAALAANNCDIDITPKQAITVEHDHDLSGTNNKLSLLIDNPSYYTVYVLYPDNTLLKELPARTSVVVDFEFVPRSGPTRARLNFKVDAGTASEWNAAWVVDNHSVNKGFATPRRLDTKRAPYPPPPAAGVRRSWNEVEFDIAGASSTFWIVH